MSGLTIIVATLCLLGAALSVVAIVQWLRQRAVLARELQRRRDFEEAVAGLKALLEPSQAWKDKEAANLAKKAALANRDRTEES